MPQDFLAIIIGGGGYPTGMGDGERQQKRYPSRQC